MHPQAVRVQERLAAAGLEVEVHELDESTRTAPEAAAAIGCEVGQILKSLVLVVDARPTMCLCAGDRRLRLEALGGDARMATPDEVRAATGFAIGGVPPLGHERPLRTIVDGSLRRFDVVWAAAGTHRAVFAVAVDALLAAIPDAELSDGVAA